MKEGKIFEEVVGVPTRVIDGTVETTKRVKEQIINRGPVKKAKDYWDLLGPGLTTGASDDDPSGIATYSQTGARYGFSLLWTAALTFPLMAIIQEMCARIGLVTGRGLAANIRTYFPKWILYVCTILLFIANTLNIGADLGAMAKATQLLFPGLNFVLLVIVLTGLSIFLQIYVPYQKYAKYLKWLALVLLSYVFSAFITRGINWSEVIKSATHISLSFDEDQIVLFCAILGTTISPYLFFWQTSQEVEEAISQGERSVEQRKAAVSNHAIKNMRVDVWSGMFLSNLVMFFIITACAATLNKAGVFEIASASDAATALRPLAGDSAYFLFAIGIIGTGLLAIPVLSGSVSYAISESLGWKQGLHFKPRQALAFYGVIIISMIVGLLINFIGLDPIKALIYAAVANGVIAPVILFLIVGISASKKIMGEYASSKLTTGIGMLISIAMGAASIITVVYLLT